MGSEIVFHSGEVPVNPRVLICGSKASLTYTQVRLHGETTKSAPVGDGAWVSEAALWVNWRHQGRLTCEEDSDLCVMGASEFQAVACSFEHNPNMEPKAYARRFCAYLRDASSSEMGLT